MLYRLNIMQFSCNIFFDVFCSAFSYPKWNVNKKKTHKKYLENTLLAYRGKQMFRMRS